MSGSSVASLLTLLQKGVNDLLHTRTYQDYLKTMSRFPQYSARNTLLIFAQRPDATWVAGYKAWQKNFGRQVRKGEKGIRIFAPYTYPLPDSDPDHPKMGIGFRSTTVFDLSQTEGKPLPKLNMPKLLDGECSWLPEAVHCLETCTGYTIKIETSSANGQIDYHTKTIVLGDHLSSLHCLKTLLHECGHALLHGQKSSDSFSFFLESRRDLREVEAESVSYVVCQALGVDCSNYSFSYLAQWKQNQPFLEQSLERIAQTAKTLLTALEAVIKKNDVPFRQEEILEPEDTSDCKGR